VSPRTQPVAPDIRERYKQFVDLARGETWADACRWKCEQRLIKIKRAADPLYPSQQRDGRGLASKGAG
jgi:hypothetical protein